MQKTINLPPCSAKNYRPTRSFHHALSKKLFLFVPSSVFHTSLTPSPSPPKNSWIEPHSPRQLLDGRIFLISHQVLFFSHLGLFFTIPGFFFTST